ncbi:MAG: hypothetical protein N2202_04200 [Proteobacteria bacterium]|nr:hypothetical protein [Pseudomonadota bacterium]
MKPIIKLSCTMIFLMFMLMVSEVIAGEGAPPISELVPVNGKVWKYAKVRVVTEPMDFGVFSGQPNEELGPVDNAVFEVETNADVNLTFSGTDLKNGNYSIKTAYRAKRVTPSLVLGYFNRSWSTYNPVGDLVVAPGQSAGTKCKYEVIGYAKLGPNVNDQIAGHYSATITLTVWAP